MRKITVVRYNPKWKVEFKKAKKFYENLLANIDITVEHVGSTSVKGLWAKPILDIDIIVRSKKDSIRVIDLLSGVGYKHIGNLGVEEREAFEYDEKNEKINWMNHHLYVCLEGSENLDNHLLLKRYLAKNKDAVERYSKLKRDLAEKYPYDIDSYIDGKTNLITEFLKEEGMRKSSLLKIKSINKID